MKYIVKLHSGETNEVIFTTKTEAFLYIGQIITDSKLPIEVAPERKYLVETLTAIVYNLYECNCERE